MKLKDGIILKKVMGQNMVVSTFGDGTHVDKMQTVNDTGAFLWEYLEKGTNEEEMVIALLSAFNVSEDTARRDVAAFCERVRAAGLLTD